MPVSRTTRGAVALAATLAVGCGASAQRDAELDPHVVLLACQGAYREGPVAEQIDVTVETSSGARHRGRITLRLDLGVGLTEQAAIDLGPLRVYLRADPTGGVATATVADRPDCLRWYFSGDISPSVLAGELPPVPVPQLGLAAAGLSVGEGLTPYTPRIRWEQTRVFEAEGLVTVSGRVISRAEEDIGRVQLDCDIGTDRMRRFVAEIAGEDGPTVIELVMTPMDPGDPASWAIDESALRMVDSLAELSTGPWPGEASPPAHELRLLTPTGRPWALSEAAARADSAIALVMYRADEDRLASQDQAVTAVGVLTALPDTDPPDGAAEAQRRQVELWALAVFDVTRFSVASLDAAIRRWRASGPSLHEGRLVAWRDVLWTASPALTIDRFAPAADAALVIFGADRRLLTAINLDGATPEDLERVVREAVGDGG